MSPLSVSMSTDQSWLGFIFSFIFCHFSLTLSIGVSIYPRHIHPVSGFATRFPFISLDSTLPLLSITAEYPMFIYGHLDRLGILGRVQFVFPSSHRSSHKFYRGHLLPRFYGRFALVPDIILSRRTWRLFVVYISFCLSRRFATLMLFTLLSYHFLLRSHHPISLQIIFTKPTKKHRKMYENPIHTCLRVFFLLYPSILFDQTLSSGIHQVAFTRVSWLSLFSHFYLCFISLLLVKLLFRRVPPFIIHVASPLLPCSVCR